jgi:hypothetical protein
MEQNPYTPKTQKWGSDTNIDDPQPQITAIKAGIQVWEDNDPDLGVDDSSDSDESGGCMCNSDAIN